MGFTIYEGKMSDKEVHLSAKGPFALAEALADIHVTDGNNKELRVRMGSMWEDAPCIVVLFRRWG